MTEVKWAISTEIFRKPGFPQIDDALTRAGIEFFQSEFNEKTREYADIPYHPGECVVMYGPIKFVRTKNRGYIPGAYGFKRYTDASFYMSQLPLKYFFNEDAVWLPWGLIGSHKDQLRSLFGNHLFIRPDSGFKSFTGFDVSIENLDFELSALQQTKHPSANEMCLIAKAKHIQGEYRLVICNHEIVTGSQYRWNDRLDIRIDVHSDAWAFAESVVAKANWQLDIVYTVDIFLGEDGPRIGEFNSFASAGLYNCDMDAIVDAVTRTAKKEWEY